MKIIDMGKGVKIETPYLTPAEAAEYCNMSLRQFWRVAKDLPQHGATSKPVFDAKDLDEFMQKERK